MRLANLFPQLRGARIEQFWGGTLGITMTRLPLIIRVAPNIVSGGGFSGHGVALSGVTGRIMAEAVLGQAERFDVPRGAAHASLPWRGDRSGAAPDHGDDVVRAAGPLGGLRP
jgi:gamma-glutamylputrescine oxidase